MKPEKVYDAINCRDKSDRPIERLHYRVILKTGKVNGFQKFNSKFTKKVKYAKNTF